MENKKIEITPTTLVNDLLDAYPELEVVLIGIAPPFKKLQNPFLRKTVAKIATMKHISSVGGIPLNELINRLRKAVGQPLITELYEDEEYFQDKPDWFAQEKIAISFKEENIEDKNTMTLVTLLREAKSVNNGEIIELITTFLPAPGIDVMKSKGYLVWTTKDEDGTIKSYFFKK